MCSRLTIITITFTSVFRDLQLKELPTERILIRRETREKNERETYCSKFHTSQFLED